MIYLIRTQYEVRRMMLSQSLIEQHEFVAQKQQKQQQHCVRKIKRGLGADAKRVTKRLEGFAPQKSEAWSKIVTLFSSGITRNELRSVAQIICIKTHLKLDRDATRDLRVLVKWFSDHWDVVSPILYRMQLRDSDLQPITLAREIHEYSL